jgi:hypothetical protein
MNAWGFDRRVLGRGDGVEMATAILSHGLNSHGRHGRHGKIVIAIQRFRYISLLKLLLARKLIAAPISLAL